MRPGGRISRRKGASKRLKTLNLLKTCREIDMTFVSVSHITFKSTCIISGIDFLTQMTLVKDAHYSQK